MKIVKKKLLTECSEIKNKKEVNEGALSDLFAEDDKNWFEAIDELKDEAEKIPGNLDGVAENQDEVKKEMLNKAAEKAEEAEENGESPEDFPTPEEVKEEAQKIWDECEKIWPNDKAVVTIGEDNVENALRACYSASLRSKLIAERKKGKKKGTKNGKGAKFESTNLFLYGRPGFGKTSRVEQFCNKFHLNMAHIRADALQMETVGGIPALVKEVDENGNLVDAHELVPAVDFWERQLGKPNTVLFLDEFNRGGDDVRNALMSLVSEHQLPDGKRGRKTFGNILFTVAAYNPSKTSIVGTNILGDAEKNRFIQEVEVGGKTEEDKKTFLKHIVKELQSDIDISGTSEDENERSFLLEPLYNKFNIAKYLVNAPGFYFDDDDTSDEEAAGGDSLTTLSFRSLSYLLSLAEDKESFIKAIDSSNLISSTKKRLKDLMSNYDDNKQYDENGKEIIPTTGVEQPENNGGKGNDQQTGDDEDDDGVNNTELQDGGTSAEEAVGKIGKNLERKEG